MQQKKDKTKKTIYTAKTYKKTYTSHTTKPHNIQKKTIYTTKKEKIRQISR